MALPSSGQLSLSQIRNEFGLGSGQIAMSQLYGKGNAPASSGQILMAANFYGTSNITFNATISNANRSQKAGLNQKGYSNGNSDTNTGNVAFGSISNTSGFGSNIQALYFHDDSPVPQGLGSPDRIRLYLNTNSTSWTSMKLSLNGGGEITYNRTAAVMNTQQGSLRRYEWGNSGGITNSGTTTVRFT